MNLALLAAIVIGPGAPTQPVEDTYLDGQLPDVNFGRDGLLVSGPKAVILIRFPELGWLPPDQEPESAVLTLHLASQADCRLKSVSRVLRDWEEGSGQRAPLVKPLNLSSRGATWNFAQQGTTKWRSAGAADEEDAQPLAGVQAVVEGDAVRLTGLGPAIAAMADDPAHNYGLRVEFETNNVFFSSEGYGPAPELSFSTKRRSGPHLVVEKIEPRAGGWGATVKNLGDEAATGCSWAWTYQGARLAEGALPGALAPGEETQVNLDAKPRPETNRPRWSKLTLRVAAGGAHGGAGGLSLAVNGLAVRFELSAAAQSAADKDRGTETLLSYLQRVVARANEAVLAQSRSSFAPEGCQERFRLTTIDEPAVVVKGDLTGADGAPSWNLVRDLIRAASPLGGRWVAPPDSPPLPLVTVGWLPDTRDDTAWPTAIALPSFPWGEPKVGQPPLPQKGLLSRAEVAVMNNWAGHPMNERHALPPVPASMILVLQDGAGHPLTDAEVQVYATTGGKLGTEPIASGRTAQSGFFFLGKHEGSGPFSDLQADGTNAWFLVRVTKNFVTESAWLSAATAIAEAARGNLNAPLVELRLMLPAGPVKRDENLALGKVASDSLNRYPAELSALTDGKDEPSVPVEPGASPAWVEIDLGRDRLIGAVEITTTGDIWDRFEIALAKTGQMAADAETWAQEANGPLRLKTAGVATPGHASLTYFGPEVRARYVRIIVREGRRVDVREIKVMPLGQN